MKQTTIWGVESEYKEGGGRLIYKSLIYCREGKNDFRGKLYFLPEEKKAWFQPIGCIEDNTIYFNCPNWLIAEILKASLNTGSKTNPYLKKFRD